jgi:hypothetical protein
VTDPPPDSPEAVGAPSSGLRFDGVTLVYRPAEGPTTTEVVSLVVGDEGVTLLGPASGARRRLPWAAVTSASCGPPQAAPDGRMATPLELTTPNWTVRLLLDRHHCPPGQIDQFQLRLPGWLGRSSVRSDLVSPTSPASPGRPSPVPSWEDVFPAPVVAPVRTSSVALPPPPAPGGSGHRPPFTPRPTWGRGEGGSTPAPRRRRTVVLVVALLLIAGGVSLAVVLGSQPRHTTSASPSTTPLVPVTPDQHLAGQVMLTQGDLPSGWHVAPGTGTTSPSDQPVLSTISQRFEQCMGITADQGATALGGTASDQTAQSSSPVFADSSTASGSGTALELQTAAAVVRTHQDEQQDFTLFTSPKFPQCNATAAAAQLQLGVNDLLGTGAAPGPATAKAITLTTSGSEQVVGVTMTFAITEGSGTIPVVVNQLEIGSDRIEAQLMTFAIGAPFPSDVLLSSIATLEHRLAVAGPTITV